MNFLANQKQSCPQTSIHMSYSVRKSTHTTTYISVYYFSRFKIFIAFLTALNGNNRKCKLSMPFFAQVVTCILIVLTYCSNRVYNCIQLCFCVASSCTNNIECLCVSEPLVNRALRSSGLHYVSLRVCRLVSFDIKPCILLSISVVYPVVLTIT